MEYKKYIVVLNVIACLGVVYLHVNNAFWEFSYEGWWISANGIECIFYFAVPVFFMVSGCTLMDYRGRCTTIEYAVRRIRKTVIPFVFWNGIIALLCESFIRRVSVKGALDNFVNSRYAGGIFWFFIPLFGIYLSIPFISLIPFSVRQRYFRYFLVVDFFTEIFIPHILEIIGIDLRDEFTFHAGVGICFTR